MTEFSENVVKIIKQIPKGRVASYGQIARLAGNNRGARAVVYILRAKRKSLDLPWHRIVGKTGQIRIKDEQWSSIQKELLENEGVFVSKEGLIDMKKFGWHSL